MVTEIVTEKTCFIEVYNLKQLTYIPFADTAITIYNKYQYLNINGKLMTEWKRSIIPNCLRITKANNISFNGTVVSAYALNVQIPMFEEYIEPYDWANLLNEEMENRFTVQNGDLIVLDEVDDEVDDFSVIEDIEKKYGSKSFLITNVNQNFGTFFPLNHIAVMG